jgi:hypothetical protein
MIQQSRGVERSGRENGERALANSFRVSLSIDIRGTTLPVHHQSGFGGIKLMRLVARDFPPIKIVLASGFPL